ncbi:MAG: hypothetical protein AB8F78_18360 [Saprospiraceae bacterium]
MQEKRYMTRWFLSFLFLGFVLVSNAQQASSIDIDLLSQGDILDYNPAAGEDLVTIDQLGNNNDVQVVQRQQSQLTNQTRIQQRGNHNLAEVLQSGGNNQVILLQKGSENTYRLDLSGTTNDIAIIQNGNQNEIRQSLSNARYNKIEFIQNGDGNLIEHQAEGLISKDIKVLQSGSNMELIINQSAVAFPSGN